MLILAKKPAYVILIVSLQKKIPVDTPSVSASESSVLRKTQTVTALHITIHALLT